jgi:hypothetical protein
VSLYYVKMNFDETQWEIREQWCVDETGIHDDDAWRVNRRDIIWCKDHINLSLEAAQVLADDLNRSPELRRSLGEKIERLRRAADRLAEQVMRTDWREE